MSQTILTPTSGSSFLNLDGSMNTGPQPELDKAYMIDWNKLQSVNDLVLILQMLGIAFPGNHPGIKQIQQFLDFNNPIALDKTSNPSTSLK